MEASGAMNLEPLMTRMGTDEAETQGDARSPGLALRFQIPSQASLHGIVQTHRSIRSANGPAFRALREMMRMG